VIISDKKKFPSGIPALAKYVHSKGLKFGLYSDAGSQTCEGRPGSYGFEKVDAQTYASWEYHFLYFRVDYLKYDNCHAPNVSAKLRYYAMGKALNESGRPIFYSICNWGQEKVWEWGATIGNSWRTTGDISNNWKSFLDNLELQVGLEKYSEIGGWNDPDMLEVGNGNLTYSESLAHFSLWCLLKAPLLIGSNFNNIDNGSLEILSNEELIAINQDSLGVQGWRIK
jgi:alpha-galactosidase